MISHQDHIILVLFLGCIFCLSLLFFLLPIVKTDSFQGEKVVVSYLFLRYLFYAGFQCLINFRVDFVETYTSGFSVNFTLSKKLSNLFIFNDSEVLCYMFFCGKKQKLSVLEIFCYNQELVFLAYYKTKLLNSTNVFK